MRHAPTVVNALRTVVHCGGSEVKNYVNTVHFLAQTDYFVSQCIATSRRVSFGFVYVYFFLLSKPWVPLTAII